MAYTPIGDKTVQSWLDLLTVNDTFNSLTEVQQIQYINFGQQECVNISKENILGYYKSTDDMGV
jgi:hypothetical protein